MIRSTLRTCGVQLLQTSENFSIFSFIVIPLNCCLSRECLKLRRDPYSEVSPRRVALLDASSATENREGNSRLRGRSTIWCDKLPSRFRPEKSRAGPAFCQSEDCRSVSYSDRGSA